MSAALAWVRRGSVSRTPSAGGDSSDAIRAAAAEASLERAGAVVKKLGGRWTWNAASLRESSPSLAEASVETEGEAGEEEAESARRSRTSSVGPMERFMSRAVSAFSMSEPSEPSAVIQAARRLAAGETLEHSAATPTPVTRGRRVTSALADGTEAFASPVAELTPRLGRVLALLPPAERSSVWLRLLLRLYREATLAGGERDHGTRPGWVERADAALAEHLPLLLLICRSSLDDAGRSLLPWVRSAAWGGPDVQLELARALPIAAATLRAVADAGAPARRGKRRRGYRATPSTPHSRRSRATARPPRARRSAAASASGSA